MMQHFYKQLWLLILVTFARELWLLILVTFERDLGTSDAVFLANFPQSVTFLTHLLLLSQGYGKASEFTIIQNYPKFYFHDNFYCILVSTVFRAFIVFYHSVTLIFNVHSIRYVGELICAPLMVFQSKSKMITITKKFLVSSYDADVVQTSYRC